MFVDGTLVVCKLCGRCPTSVLEVESGCVCCASSDGDEVPVWAWGHSRDVVVTRVRHCEYAVFFLKLSKL